MATDTAHPDQPLGEYALSRDFIDSNRLNLQHYLWRDIYGYILHPSIPRGHDALRVADVGSGTGIWLYDVLRELPQSTKTYGFDNDITQTAPKPWLPQNLEMIQWDATTEPPAEYVGTFDIVHLRLFLFIVKGSPEIILSNLVKLLKPGGWLQWAESDSETVQVQTTTPDTPAQALHALYNKAAATDKRLRPTWVKDLPQYFTKAGLDQVEADRRAGEPYTNYLLHECNLMLYEMFMDKMSSQPEQRDELKEALSRAGGQSRGGAMITFDRIIVVGRKPL